MSLNNVESVLKELASGNNYKEKVTIVAATKTRSAEEINAVIDLGITDTGENRVNEFCEKHSLVRSTRQHFIGHLQTNKVKYLIGKTYLIHSVDRLALAQEISKRSVSAGIITNILIQINIGEEDTKGGFLLTESDKALQAITSLPGIRVKGLMAMLPHTDNYKLLEKLCREMRSKYDEYRKDNKSFEYLSVGMSGDYKIAVNSGSNMVRLGSLLFGARIT